MTFMARLAPVMAAVIVTACAQGTGLGSSTETSTQGATTVIETTEGTTDEPTTGDPSDSSTSTSEGSDTTSEATETETETETDSETTDSESSDSETDATTEPPEPVCGDAVVDPGESCDDGNDIAGDGCNPDCNPSNELLWDLIIGGDEAESDQGYAVAVDPTGNYYIGGLIRVPDEGANAWLTKYSPAGDPTWTYTHNGPNNSTDVVRAIAIGPDQEVYFTGNSRFDGNNADDLWVVKLDPSGAPVWDDRVNTLAEGHDRGHGILVTPQGNVVVAGYLRSASQSNNLWMRQYNDEGVNQWTKTYNGMADKSDVAFGLAAASDDSLYVAGYETDANSTRKGLLVKFSGSGDLLWSQRYGPVDNAQEFTGVAVGPDDDVYVSGFAWHEMAGQELTVHRFTPEGEEIWSYHYQGELKDGARAEALAVGSDGAIVVGGYEDIGSDKRMILLKLGADGTQWWSHQVFGNGVPNDIAHAVAIGDDLQIYATGQIADTMYGLQLWAGRLSP